jgi:uncharacterized protein DUF6459
MTTSRVPSERPSLTSPMIEYEPPATAPDQAICPSPSHSALHRQAARRLRPVPLSPPETPLPRTAVRFADSALRRVLEVIDRRRPVAQLRGVLSAPLIDAVVAQRRCHNAAPAALRRVRLRPADIGATAAEVFASYSRAGRVRAIAARIEWVPAANRWQIVALQIG